METEQNEIIGYVCCFIAVLFFGSNFVVVKKYPTGDGFFFQWVMCIGILLVGIFSLLFHTVINGGSILFEPFGMLGGMIWCTGNLLCVPVIQMIGLSLGPGIWGVANMIMGWLTGTFGFFGLKSDKDTINIFWLNCLGAALSALSVPLYALIKTSSKEDYEKMKMKQEEEKEKESLSDSQHDGIEMNTMYSISSSSKENEQESVSIQNHQSEYDNTTSSSSSDIDDHYPMIEENNHHDEKTVEVIQRTHSLEEIPMEKDYQEEDVVKVDSVNTQEEGKEIESPIFTLIKSLPKWIQMLVGLVLAVISGILFGSAFNPSKYLQDNNLSSSNGIDYVLPHFLGIFLTSTMYFICYVIVFRNKPFIYKQTILPGIISGMMWGIAQVCWFIANTNLPYVVSYPLICAGPGLLSALWGILLFKEIHGWKNFLFFGGGTLMLIGGIVCICVSIKLKDMNTDTALSYISSMISSESSYRTLVDMIDEMGLEVMDFTIA